MYQEIVVVRQWQTDEQFSSMLALGNTLPGPIATKIAASVGYGIFGWIGLLLALAATIVPSAVALIVLTKLLQRHRQSNMVKGMTLLVQPVIAILMVTLTWQMAETSLHALGFWQSLAIAAVAWWAMQRRKIHPAVVIVASFAYGGIVVPLLP